MARTKFWSPFMLVAFLHLGNCGNPHLTALEAESDSLNRIVAFGTQTHQYNVWTNGGDTVVVRATTAEPSASVTWRLFIDGVFQDFQPLGTGGGEITLTIPPGTPSEVQLDVNHNGEIGRYTLNVNPLCAADECDDANECTSDACVASACEFTTASADGEYCANGTGNLDVCSAGVCTSDAITKSVQMTCSSAIGVVTEFWTLTVDPSGPVVAGQPFDVTISGAIDVEDGDDGIAVFGNVLLTRAFRFGSIPVEARSGASGFVSADIWAASAPYVCGSDGSPCDPANDTAGTFSENTDCPVSGDWCLPFTPQTIIDSSADTCASCTEPSNPPFSGSLKNALCMQGEIPSTPNYACTDSVPTPLVPVTATFVAGTGATEVLFGFEEPFLLESSGPGFNDGIGFDAVIGLEDAPSSNPVEPSGTGFLAYSCYMGAQVIGSQPPAADPLPDSALVSIPVEPAPFPCTEQGILDAIAAGGGPHYFDCAGPTTVTTSSQFPIAIDKDVILDGEGNIDLLSAFQITEQASVEIRGFSLLGGIDAQLTDDVDLVVVDTRASGVGMYGDTGSLVVRGSSFDRGGSVLFFVSGDVEVSDSTFTGVFESACTGCGRGLQAETASGSISIWNSTFVGDNEFGLIVTSGSEPPSVTHVTTNRLTTGYSFPFPESVQVSNSIVFDQCFSPVGLVSLGNNVEVGTDTCGFTDPTDQAGVTPAQLNLGPLQDNGGPTQTLLPGPGSVTIDAIPPANCLDVDGLPLTSDQRGISRPQGTNCDVGAVEVEQP